MDNSKKKVVFAFVEAGLGHIMPMTAVCDAFERKYGGTVQVVRTKFFQDTNDEGMKFVEQEFVREVKKHNKNRFRGFMQFLLLKVFGQRLSLKFLFKLKYRRANEPALKYLSELNADLIFNTHFGALFYSCEAREKGLIKSRVLTYCPDPVIAGQWDRRSDLIALSSAAGADKARKGRLFRHTEIVQVPFLIRSEVKSYDKGRQYYRRALGLPQDKFTVLLADGAYGAGKLKDTVYELLKSTRPMNVIAVCGKNEELFKELSTINVPEHITFMPLGFTDKMLMLSACCDLFIGKAGASNLAEPAYFGVPAIVTFCATPIEDWICEHYTDYVGCAVKITDVHKAVKLCEGFIDNPKSMEKYIEAAGTQRRCDGPEILADIIYEQLHRQG